MPRESCVLQWFPEHLAQLTFTFSEPVEISAIILTSANDKPEADPSSFTLYCLGQPEGSEASGEGRMTFFVDGVSIGDIPTNEVVSEPKVGSIGGLACQVDENFGMMADLRLFRKALAPTEVAALYNKLRPVEDNNDEMEEVEKVLATLRNLEDGDEDTIEQLQGWLEAMSSSELTKGTSLDDVGDAKTLQSGELQEDTNEAQPQRPYVADLTISIPEDPDSEAIAIAHREGAQTGGISNMTVKALGACCTSPCLPM